MITPEFDMFLHGCAATMLTISLVYTISDSWQNGHIRSRRGDILWLLVGSAACWIIALGFSTPL